MNTPRPSDRRLRAAFACAAFSIAALVQAQNKAPAPEEPIQLSPFTVTGTPPSPYQATETTSGRIAESIFLTPQAVNVVTSQLIQDLGANHMLDSVQYVSPGVSNGSQSVGLDRVTVRGFQTDLHISDGFIDTNLNKGFPQINESFEIVKGPSAILSPFAPQPGGTINWITKKPSFRGDFGSATVEAGQWDSGFGSIDVNRVINPHLAARVVVAGVDGKSYTGESRKGYVAMPEITWRLGSAELLLQAQVGSYKTTVNSGVPLDYTIGTATHVSVRNMVAAGVPWNTYTSDPDDFRNDVEHNYLAVFTDKLTDALSVRVAGHAALTSLGFLQFNTTGVAGAPSTGAMTNPLTGAYTPGFTYGNASTGFAPTAVPIPTETGAVWTRAASSSNSTTTQYDFQNDWNYEFSTDHMKSDTTAGVADTWYPLYGNRGANIPANGGTKPNFDPANQVATTATVAAGASPTSINFASQEVDQYYLNENLSLFKDRIVLSGSLSENQMKRKQINTLLQSPSPNPLQPNPASVDVSKLLKSYGIVVSPLPYVAFYYGHGETSLPVVTVNGPTSTALASIPGGLPFTQDSKGDEAGIRLKTLDGRSTASVDYFQDYQTNNSVPNPANLALAPGQPTLPPLFADVVSRGWEYQFNAAVTPEFSILGVYTHFKISNTFGQPIRAVAQSSGAAYANYKFTSGGLKGFQVGVGVIHVSQRAVDNPSAGSTAAGTPTSFILFQPTAWLPPYTVVNLTSSYQVNAQWKVSAYLDNVFNEYYFTGGLNRFNVFAGALRGFRASVTYSF